MIHDCIPLRLQPYKKKQMNKYDFKDELIFIIIYKPHLIPVLFLTNPSASPSYLFFFDDWHNEDIAFADTTLLTKSFHLVSSPILLSCSTLFLNCLLQKKKKKLTKTHKILNICKYLHKGPPSILTAICKVSKGGWQRTSVNVKPNQMCLFQKVKLFLYTIKSVLISIWRNN